MCLNLPVWHHDDPLPPSRWYPQRIDTVSKRWSVLNRQNVWKLYTWKFDCYSNEVCQTNLIFRWNLCRNIQFVSHLEVRWSNTFTSHYLPYGWSEIWPGYNTRREEGYHVTPKCAQCVMMCVSCPDFISHRCNLHARDEIYSRTIKIKGQANWLISNIDKRHIIDCPFA